MRVRRISLLTNSTYKRQAHGHSAPSASRHESSNATFCSTAALRLRLEAGSRISERIVVDALLGYSYKFPVVDAHAGYAICANEFLPGSCRDAIRLSVTTNSIKATTIEANTDIAPGKGRTITSVAVTRDLYATDRWSSSVRVGWTENRQDRANKLQAISARLIASVKLNEPLSLDFVVGHHWNLERHAYPIPKKSAFASLSLVMRR
jgi:hypothetical protein